MWLCLGGSDVPSPSPSRSCSLLLFCHLLPREGSCPSLLLIPRVSQGNRGAPGVPHSVLLTHSSRSFVCRAFWGRVMEGARGSITGHVLAHGMALPNAGQQLGKGGAFPQHQHNALHFHGISGGDKEHFIPIPPSDVWQGAKSTDFSEEAKTSCSLVR